MLKRKISQLKQELEFMISVVPVFGIRVYILYIIEYRALLHSLMFKYFSEFRVLFLGNSVTLYFDSGSTGVMLYELYYRRLYELEDSVVDSVNFNVNKIIDLGANVGLATIKLSNCFNKIKTIDVYEPNLINYNLCKKNLLNMDSKKEVNFFNFAVGKTEEEVFMNGKGVCCFVLVDGARGNYGQPVKQVPPQNIFTSLRRDTILKIDIEGSETDLFSHTEWLQQVLILFIEFHDGTDVIIIPKILEAGFVLYPRYTSLQNNYCFIYNKLLS